MDAKPQRPLRTLRVHGDENIPPVTNASKTLHSRNKSSPALSTMAAIGALKGAVKRTAFGDVSNTANIHRPSRDDSVINGKSEYEMSEKIVHIQRDKKPTTFLRPAQRPLSEAITKGSVNHTGITLVSATSKAIVAETQQSLQIANTRKVIKKKSTPIFRDAASSKLVQDSIEVQGAPGPTKAPVPHGPSDPHLKENPRLPEVAAEPQNQTRKTKSKPIPPPEVIKEGTAPSAPTTVEIRDPYSEEAPYFNNNGAIQLGEYSDYIQENCHVEPLSNGFVDAHTALQEVVGEPIKNRYDPSIETQPTAQQDVGYKHKLLPVSEPEEYWDDDEEEDNYDEEGYVTAPSKSLRGDNTTGGATTILFPKVNNKTKREIAAAKEVVEASRTAEEIEDEAWDMSMVAEYGDEIFAYMKELEIKMLPNAHYMDNQAEIQWSMRSVLMDWLVQVHHRFGLLPETLFLCVNYIDRFLSCKIVSLGKLQLVGATAIFVAAKYEEINCPSVQEIVYMVDGGYSVDEILKAERFMLSMLQFELGWPGPMSFLRRISKADDYDLETRTLAKYFLEITIMDERFLGSPPSYTAAGAHCLARMMLKKGSWSQHHVHYSAYTYTQLYPLVQLLLSCCEDPQKHHSAIYDKYTDKRFKRASHFVENEVRKGFQLLDPASLNHAAMLVNVCGQLWGPKH